MGRRSRTAHRDHSAGPDAFVHLVLPAAFETAARSNLRRLWLWLVTIPVRAWRLQRGMNVRSQGWVQWWGRLSSDESDTTALHMSCSSCLLMMARRCLFGLLVIPSCLPRNAFEFCNDRGRAYTRKSEKPEGPPEISVRFSLAIVFCRVDGRLVKNFILCMFLVVQGFQASDGC